MMFLNLGNTVAKAAAPSDGGSDTGLLAYASVCIACATALSAGSRQHPLEKR